MNEINVKLTYKNGKSLVWKTREGIPTTVREILQCTSEFYQLDDCVELVISIKERNK